MKPPILVDGLEPFTQRIRAGRRCPRRPFFAALKRLAQLNHISGLLPSDYLSELAKLPPLESRGHGGKHRPYAPTVMGRAMKDRSKYSPNVCFAKGCA